MTKLFLLKSAFQDKNLSNNERYYCPHCAMIEGVITYFPKLKELIDIIYVDFERPRKEIIQLIGNDNQSCPVIIIHKDEIENNEVVLNEFSIYEDYYFSDSKMIIAKYLANKYTVSYPHP